MPFHYEKSCPHRCGFRVGADDEGSVDRLLEEHADLGCSVPPLKTSDVLSRVSQYLRRQASMRFGEHGPHDARGAAFWDAANVLTEHPNDVLTDDVAAEDDLRPHDHGLICRPEQTLRCIDCGQTYLICEVCHADVYGHHAKCRESDAVV